MLALQSCLSYSALYLMSFICALRYAFYFTREFPFLHSIDSPFFFQYRKAEKVFTLFHGGTSGGGRKSSSRMNSAHRHHSPHRPSTSASRTTNPAASVDADIGNLSDGFAVSHTALRRVSLPGPRSHSTQLLSPTARRSADYRRLWKVCSPTGSLPLMLHTVPNQTRGRDGSGGGLLQRRHSLSRCGPQLSFTELQSTSSSGGGDTIRPLPRWTSVTSSS